MKIPKIKNFFKLPFSILLTPHLNFGHRYQTISSLVLDFNYFVYPTVFISIFYIHISKPKAKNGKPLGGPGYTRAATNSLTYLAGVGFSKEGPAASGGYWKDNNEEQWSARYTPPLENPKISQLFVF
jgi:hypothetical protein